MKKILLILIINLILNPTNIKAQIEEYSCGTQPLPGESVDLSQEGGVYLTANGLLKMLIVFVSFKDDTLPHPYWPVGQPPYNYDIFIDPSLNTNSAHYNNFTNYFKQMSLGMFKVIGQAVSVKTPQNKAAYLHNYSTNRYLATKDVLQNAVDPLINFSEYDNWSSTADYTHINQPDGNVDMIVMVWRGSNFEGFSGEASLGGSDPYPPNNNFFSVENGTKSIKTGWGLNQGSGVTANYPYNTWHEWMFKVTSHEIGHWLLGSYHPYTTNMQKHRIWGILSAGATGVCANSYERERLAWIDPTPITGDVLNSPIQDYINYGTAYKYHPPSGETNEYYYFENHQKVSIYDYATVNNNDKGILVLHQRGPYFEINNIRVKTSNGLWNWENPFNSNCWGSTVPSFKPFTVNRQGYSNRDVIPASGGANWLFSLINESGQAVCGDWLHGGVLVQREME